MSFNVIKSKKALRKSVLRIRPTRQELNVFKAALTSLRNEIDITKSEEFNKKLISDFFSHSFYTKSEYFINVKGSADLAIHNGPNSVDDAAVLLEIKSPSNTSEMVTTSDLNRKSFHELLLYYMRDRFAAEPNISLRNLIITNGIDWYIFDAVEFEGCFAKDKQLVKEYMDFAAGRLGGQKTEFFYREIAAKYVVKLSDDFTFTHFNVGDLFEKSSGSFEISEESLLIAYRLFCPPNLLKLDVDNDSNHLNRSFYTELLHILGLEEFKTSTRRLIRRKIRGGATRGVSA